MTKGMPSMSLQDWKAATASLIPQKRRWYDAGSSRQKVMQINMNNMKEFLQEIIKCSKICTVEVNNAQRTISVFTNPLVMHKQNNKTSKQTFDALKGLEHNTEPKTKSE
ncbi:Hypothetical_protein [Hexamita inflata]|uniref:Hypothetical_protein n=1 Tax=Hexamita inflata TaxID=28002 RepID=A0AA86Q8H9_9EUKA|nr:Hypothetical protein HINF_LOCUS40918 [Hexamita inflata]